MGQQNAQSAPKNAGRTFSRIMGTIMVPAGWAGIALFLVFMLIVPLGVNIVFNQAGSTARESAALLSNISGALDSTSNALESAGGIVQNTSNTIDRITESLTLAVPFLRSTGELVGENAPKTIEATNNALKSAESGARAIDGVLKALSTVSFLTGIQYNPERSLSESIKDTSDSLEPLPGQLRDIQDMLSGFATTIEETQPDFEDTDSELETVGKNLTDMSTSLSEAAENLRHLSDLLIQFAELLTVWKWAAVVMIEFSILWLIFGQITIVYVGRRLKIENAAGPEE
jgi:uncharacterized protein YoxC